MAPGSSEAEGRQDGKRLEAEGQPKTQRLSGLEAFEVWQASSSNLQGMYLDDPWPTSNASWEARFHSLDRRVRTDAPQDLTNDPLARCLYNCPHQLGRGVLLEELLRANGPALPSNYDKAPTVYDIQE